MKKIRILLLLLALFVLGTLLGRMLKNHDSKKHIHRVGIIHKPENTPKDSVVMDWYRGVYHTYSSAAPNIYKGSKYRFKKKIFKAINTADYTDNGYLSLRFIINPKGEIILNETIEMNLDLERHDLDNALVDKIKNLSFEPDNWHPYLDTDHNYYMHLTYRIENGNITEIIP